MLTSKKLKEFHKNKIKFPEVNKAVFDERMAEKNRRFDEEGMEIKYKSSKNET
tara:strand:+ start:312 stop:470 length:159 start_codon:yes stop_codon:yes gene_type:complete